VCSSGWTKSGNYCLQQECSAARCGTVAGSGALACFTGSCKGDAKNTGAGWSCYTTDGGPGGYWGNMNANTGCGSSAVTFKCWSTGGTSTCSGGSLYRAGTASTDVCYCRDSFPQAYTCPAGYTRTSTTCYAYQAAAYQCTAAYTLSGSVCLRAAAFYYSCPQGGSLSGSTCILTQAATPVYSCPNGGSPTGATCNVGAGACAIGL
jgi:conjugal transfer mating pair stabilization protein TraN